MIHTNVPFTIVLVKKGWKRGAGRLFKEPERHRKSEKNTKGWPSECALHLQRASRHVSSIPSFCLAGRGLTSGCSRGRIPRLVCRWALTPQNSSTIRTTKSEHLSYPLFEWRRSTSTRQLRSVLRPRIKRVKEKKV